MHNDFKPSLKKCGRLKMKNAKIFLKFFYPLFALLFFLYPHSSFAQGNPLPAPYNSQAPATATPENPPSRVARISFLKGRVSFLRAGLDQWSEATLNFPLTIGDRIYTDAGSRAELEVGPYTIRLAAATDLSVTNLNDQIIQLGLEQGTMRFSVHQFIPGDTLEIDTPNGALTLLAQGTYRVDTAQNGSGTTVSVNSGKLEITGPGFSQTLVAGQAAKLTGQNPIAVESVPMPALDDFDMWCEERDARLASSKSAQYVSRSIPGYADLDDYGTWQIVPEYGPIWYPAGVAVDWIPYRFGHWAWIGPWGWTWVEDEPWGFCQFHYGRWVHIGVAWGWLPGPYVVAPVYAPALVAFVGGPGFSIGVGVGGVGFAAWFPLGPGEPFFPWYHYGGDYLRVVNITNIRNVTNITNVINVRNISDIHYAYKSVATTAVPAKVFAGGEAVAHNVVRVSPEQLAKAQITPHPNARPTMSAAMPGRPTATPPVRPATLLSSRGPVTPAGRTTTAENRPASLVARNTTAGGPAGRLPAPSETRGATASMTTSPPKLITRSAPPLARVPFADQREPMLSHPGRPLEPQQLENLRRGLAPGPMLDKEFPPHVAGIPRVRADAHSR
jgi:hypothetical protein